MKSSSLAKKYLKDTKAVFGLTSVQAFFGIILGIALLAYVIVVIMGTLSNSNIIANAAATTNSEAGGAINFTGYTVTNASIPGFGQFAVLTAVNTTDKTLITSANYTVNAATGTVTNATSVIWPAVTFNYTFTYNTAAENQANAVLGNTSTGVTGFFSSVNPVYAILAILVIILVLVVLVRVVTGSTGSGGGRLEDPTL